MTSTPDSDVLTKLCAHLGVTAELTDDEVEAAAASLTSMAGVPLVYTRRLITHRRDQLRQEAAA